MKGVRGAIALVVLLSAVAGPVQAADTVVTSRIQSVTVYSDRARVTRSGEVTLGSAPGVFVFEKLPGWVDDGSVRVSVSPPDAARIADVRVKRSYLAKGGDEAYLKAEAAVEELTAAIAVLDDDLKILAAQARQVEAIRAFTLEKISKDAPLREISVASYRNVVEFITNTLRETAKERRAAEWARAHLLPRLTARQRELAELKGMTQLEETSVLVTLEGTARAATISLTYMLPGATWEPVHELRTSAAKPGQAELTSYAVVTQTSGEDWENVAIAFATQSSVETIRIPELEALTLGETATSHRVVTRRASSFGRAKAAYQGQNRMWNRYQSKSHSEEEVYETNFQQLQVTQSKTVEIFKTLRKRGTTAHFKGQGVSTIRADGHAVRVRIGEVALTAVEKIVAAPERSLNAARTLQMVNSNPQPFLPGRVGLYRDGAFLGLTDLGFVAEGEAFAMFLGVADHLKLSRVLDKKQSSIIRKKRTRMQISYIVTVENLSDAETRATVADRVPVSENAEIAVDRVSVSDGASPDAKGLLKWELTLAPKQKKTFRISYRIEYPPTLILRTRAKVERRSRSASPASPAPSAGDAPIEEKIMNLEGEL